MIRAYYKLVALPDEVKKQNKFSSKMRLDCIEYTETMPDRYKGLTNFVNSKGMFFVYKTEPYHFVTSDSKRISDWSLTLNGLNLSSIYIEDLDFSEIGYGYPNANRTLGIAQTPNPLFDFRNDAYLFVVNKDYSEIELYVIIDGRNLIKSYYQTMIDGGLDLEIRKLKEQAKPFYNYLGL
ncbi:MAG: hypothetical protein NTW25_11515 [Candidatus Kapabacteria bacterium]|nr:hypothetical protein [Candidatus Kapabacteria bacterium]